MKASTITTIVALAIAGLNTATARFWGFDLTCKQISYTNLISDSYDNRSVIMEALCTRLRGDGPQLTRLDLKTCIGWDTEKCTFVTPPWPRNTSDAFTQWCSSCSIGTGSREGYEIHPSLDCECQCYKDYSVGIGKIGEGSFSLSKCMGFSPPPPFFFPTFSGLALLTWAWQALISAMITECLSAELTIFE